MGEDGPGGRAERRGPQHGQVRHPGGGCRRGRGARIGRRLLLLPFAAWAAASAALGQPAITRLPYDTLPEFIGAVKAGIPGAGSQAFVLPSAFDRERFHETVQSLLAGRVLQAAASSSSVRYDVARLEDRAYGRHYYVLVEQAAGFRGQGTYIVDPAYRRNLILEVPHPIYDRNTPEESARLFQELAARGLFISGTHRCANAERSPCSGTTTACDAVASPHRISDAAHFDLGFFQAAHRAALSLVPPPLVISVHGYSDAAEPDITLSDGTRAPAPESAPVNRLRNALRLQGVDAYSCNLQEGVPLSYCGTTNVQGRLSNGSAEPCSAAAAAGSGLFIHMEQKPALRAGPEKVIAALAQAVPAETSCESGEIATTFFPQIAAGGGYETAIALVNTQPAPATALLTFTDANGFPLNLPLQGGGSQPYRMTFELPPRARVTVVAGCDQGSPLTRGWARIDACPWALHGVAAYRSMDEKGIKEIVAVLDSSEVGAATVLVDSDDREARYTGLAVANPGDTDIRINLHVVRPDGSLDRILAPPELNPLRPGTQIARFLHEFDPELIRFQGSLILSTADGGRFTVVALMEDRGHYAAVPVIPGGSAPPP